MTTTPDPSTFVSIEEAVAWITISNPKRRNAVTSSMCRALGDIVESLSSRDDIRVVVVRGAGDAAFVSGADISTLEPSSDANFATFRGIHALAVLKVPVIAMIHGYCIGGGLAIAVDADIRVAADDAVFAIPAPRLGVAYPLEETTALVRIVGPGTASDLLFSGGRLDAVSALRVGLVQHVVAKSELETKVRMMAAEIAANAPLSIRLAKAAIRHQTLPASETESDKQRIEGLVAGCVESTDFVEGQRAFLEKRKPVFTGR